MPNGIGAGYIIFDPETGDGAYKISGGKNGGIFWSILLGFLLFMILIITFLIVALLPFIALGLAGLMVLTLSSIPPIIYAAVALMISGMLLHNSTKTLNNPLTSKMISNIAGALFVEAFGFAAHVLYYRAIITGPFGLFVLLVGIVGTILWTLSTSAYKESSPKMMVRRFRFLLSPVLVQNHAFSIV